MLEKDPGDLAVMQHGGYRRRPGALKAKTPQALALLLHIFETIVLENIMGLEKTVEYAPCFKTEEPPQLRLSEMPVLILFQRHPYRACQPPAVIDYCMMRRLHLFEFGDQQWFPQILRDAETS